MLILDNIYAGYQNLDILSGITLHVNTGEIVCVIGPNGAGKSTVFKAIYGFARVRQGKVIFNGQNITNWRPQQLLQIGIAIVPQLRTVFPQMSVLENIELGMYLEKNQTLVKERIEYVFQVFPEIANKRYQLAGNLSGGQQRMLEIGRALMLKPKLVMMDEPSAGLSPRMTKTLFQDIQRLNQETGLTVLMIEQNARQGLETSHRGYVLELGKNTFEGAADALLYNPDVRRAFLGHSV